MASFAAGIRTRLSCVVLFVLVASLHQRNPYCINGGDTLMRCLLFWSMFLPWERVWSWDNGWKWKGRVCCSGWTAAILCQMALPYVVSWFQKTGVQWADGTAFAYAVKIQYLAYPWAESLAAFSIPISLSTMWLESWGVVVLVLSGLFARLRIAAVVVFMVFHLSIASSMYIAHFPIVCMIGLVLFVPGEVWGRRPSAAAWGKAGSSAVAIGLLGCVLVWCEGTITGKWAEEKALLRMPVKVTRLVQNWNMFAPCPQRSDGWFDVVARLRSGQVVELLNGQGLGRPADLAADLGYYRRGKYIRAMVREEQLRKSFVNSVVRRWNIRNSDKVSVVWFVYHEELTRLNGEEEPVNKRVLWKWRYPRG